MENVLNEQKKLRGVVELLKATWALFVPRIWTLLLTMLVGGAIFAVGPVLLVGLAKGLVKIQTGMLAGLTVLVLLPITLVGFCIFQLALMYVSIDQNIGTKEALRKAMGKLLPFLGLGVLLVLLISGGYFFFLIPGVIFTISFFFAPFILLVEDTGGLQAIWKSKHYAKGYWWALLWRFLAIGIITGLLGVIPFVGGILTLVLMPFTLIYYFQIYRDLQTIKSDVPFVNEGKAGLLSMSLIGLLLFAGVAVYAVSKAKQRLSPNLAAQVGATVVDRTVAADGLVVGGK